MRKSKAALDKIAEKEGIEVFRFTPYTEWEYYHEDSKNTVINRLKTRLPEKEMSRYMKKWYHGRLNAVIELAAVKHAKFIREKTSRLVATDEESAGDNDDCILISRINLSRFNFSIMTPITVCEKDGMIGYAVCSPEDTVYYDKRFGYQIAMERLLLGLKLRDLDGTTILRKNSISKKVEFPIWKKGIIDKNKRVGMFLN